MKKTKTILLLLGALALGAIVVYSIIFTIQSGALKSGVVTCLENGECFWTAHIHSYVVIRACGEEKELPREVGPLTTVHTHEERNIFHWHDRLLYDTEKKNLRDSSALTLGASFKSVEVPFETEKIFNIKNGDTCKDGTKGTWKMFVNGRQNISWESYVWRDLDTIVFIFNNQTAEDVERELKLNPISFPALGRG